MIIVILFPLQKSPQKYSTLIFLPFTKIISKNIVLLLFDKILFHSLGI